MQLSNVLFFAGVFTGSMVFPSAPSGSLALRYVLKEGTHMRNIFLAGAKIIGLLAIFWAIRFIPSIGWAIVQARTGSMSANVGVILNIYLEFAILVIFWVDFYFFVTVKISLLYSR